MTIALGILTRKCIIIAADSEESINYPGDMKSSVGKISVGQQMNLSHGIPKESKTCIISGAGDSAYLACLKQHIMEDFSEDSVTNIKEFDTILRWRVKKFHDDHVVPFNDTNLRVDLIVGAAIKYHTKLWVSNLGTVRNIETYKFAYVGSGMRWASNVQGAIDASVEEVSASLAAAYAVAYAKEYAGGCGKQTQMVMLPPNGFYQTASGNVLYELDGVFRRYLRLESQIRNLTLGLPCPDLFCGSEAFLKGFAFEVATIAANMYPKPTPDVPS